MNIKVVKNIAKANAITHGSLFHADEVLATAILGHVIPNLFVARVYNVPKVLDPSVIVYDIGNGPYDHHQRVGNGERDNGVPYASAGLIWRRYGHEVCKNTADPEDVWEYVDRFLVQGVDASDNGVLPAIKYQAQAMSVAQIVSGFYPVWDADMTPDVRGLTAADYAFVRAVEFVSTILDNTIKFADAKARAKYRVEEAIDNAEDGVMVLSQYMPWKECLLKNTSAKAADIRVVVYPDKRNGYAWCTVPHRAEAPDAWRGLNGEALQEVTGCKTAVFVHTGGFLGGARALEDSISMAKRVAATSIDEGLQTA